MSMSMRVPVVLMLMLAMISRRRSSTFVVVAFATAFAVQCCTSSRRSVMVLRLTAGSNATAPAITGIGRPTARSRILSCMLHMALCLPRQCGR